ncbi:class I tRNA ligase family protein, partial [Candidatus Bathyarchaeota archaeon]|nr:class I tRNA ligase family protein [Candidatus Bathyarchaeota archaeon]
VADQLVLTLAILLAPFLPASAERLWKTLGMDGSVHQQKWSDATRRLAVGHKISKPSPLFRKLDLKELPKLAS